MDKRTELNLAEHRVKTREELLQRHRKANRRGPVIGHCVGRYGGYSDCASGFRGLLLCLGEFRAAPCQEPMPCVSEVARGYCSEVRRRVLG